jgi:uncharacterized protein
MSVADHGTLLTLSQRGALTLIRAYKLLFSLQFAGSCRFVPSCSAYAAESVARYGVFRGSLLALRRLSRCHPLGPSGYDPVPGPPSQTPQI